MDKEQIKIKTQAITYENDARYAQQESQKEKNIAKLELKRGNRAAARLHAQNALRYDAQAKQLLSNASALHGFLANMENAKNTEISAQALAQTTNMMDETAKKMKIKKIEQSRTEYDETKEKVQTANNIMNNGEGQMEVDAMAQDIMSQMDDEIMEENRMSADIPKMQMPVAQQKDNPSRQPNHKIAMPM